MEDALKALERGGVVAAATESFYGLLVDVTRPEAISKLLAIKRRGEKGMPVLLPSVEAWQALVVEVPPLARRLAERFWPGALTIAVTAAGQVDERLTLGGTLGVRLPGASPAASLVRRYGRPLTATSANPPGAPATREASGVRAAFSAAIAAGDLLVYDEAGPGGSLSTVVVVRGDELDVVRVGAISERQLQDAIS